MTHRPGGQHFGHPIGVLLLALLLGACATAPRLARDIPPLAGPSAGDPPITIAELDLLQLSPAMESFLENHVRNDAPNNDLAWSLVWAAGDRNLLRFRYDPGLTLDPQETFNQGSGNCLAFSGMVVAMARHLGLKAWYQEVEIPPRWSQRDTVMLVSKHVNAVVEGGRGQWVVDVSGQGRSEYRQVRRITDAEALAQFYNNFGADALAAGDLPLAYAWFVQAIRTRPQLAYVWSNLGVIYSRNGQQAAARQAYLQALELDPAENVATHNLSLIYEREGHLEEAEKLRAEVERHRRNNPYYLYHLSSLADQQGRYQESNRMLQQAIRLNAREYRFHYALARVLAQLGDRPAAQQSLRRASELAPKKTWLSQVSVDQLPPLPD